MQARLPLAYLGEGSITKVMLGETPIVLVRSGGIVRAFGGTCPHAGAPLEQGALCNGRLVCPWHKGTFAIEDGAVLEPPPLDGLKRYPVQTEGDHFTVSSDPLPSPPAPRGQRAHVAAMIGSGAAGAAAACALRQGGFDGRVLLIGEEAAQPYDRTVLSKFVVAGQMAPADVPPLREGNNWQALDVERLDITVTRVDAAARRIM